MSEPMSRISAEGFDVRVSATGTTRTVTAAGEIDLAGTPALDAALHGAIDQAPETVVLDLTGVEFIDSSGIHAIIRAHRHAICRGVRLVILPAAETVHAAFRICGLENVLPFVGARAEYQVPATEIARQAVAGDLRA